MKKLLFLSILLLLTFNSYGQIGVNQPTDIEICDSDGDGFEAIDLSIKIPEILNGLDPVSYSVSFHNSLQDADFGSNPLAIPYTNISNPETIFVRVFELATGNYEVTSFDLIVNPTPAVNLPTPLVACDFDLDGFTTFNLSSKIDEITNGQPNLVVSFYETKANADADVNPLLPNNYTNIIANLQTLFVRVTNANPICATLLTLDLIADQNCDPGSVLVMQNGTFNACEGFFTDSGGLAANYAPNEDYTITICPENAGDVVSLNFTNFTTQINIDNLSIYDGDSVASDFLGTFSGVTSPGLVTASANNASGCLTLTFTTNATGNTLGWVAEIMCFQPCVDFTPSINVTSHEVSNSGVYIVGIGDTVLLEANNTNTVESFNYSWNFGDGNMADGPNTSYQFNTEGSYDVVLNATLDGSNDCTELETITVVVLDENVVTYPTQFTVEELIRDVFLGGQCSQVFNVSYSTGVTFSANEPNGISYFSSAGDSFPISEGLLISSGNAADAGGPNSVNLSDGSGNWPGDADLETAIPGIQSNNATVIEFDFIPVINDISFDFLMASEEYDQGSFECYFSDAFAFLLTDAQGNTTNLAVLPGTDTPILVTNVHPDNGECGAANEEYFGEYTPQNGSPIAFNGRTVTLTAEAEVNIGESYHIKLVIADDRDSAFDSAVFLRAGSLDIGELCNDIGLINTKSFIDANSNGILDPGELDFNQGYFTYEKNNDGVINNVNTNIGNFSIVSDNESDSYDITFNFYDDTNNCFVNVTQTVSDLSVLGGEVVTVNFPVEIDQPCEDVAVYLINPFESPRPGFSYSNQLILENIGNAEVSSGTIEVMVDEGLTFLGINNLDPNYIVTSTPTGFELDFTDLSIGETAVIDIALLCNISVPLDEIVTNTASYITNQNDNDASNDISELSEVVIGSYDPNDIFEAHGPEIVYEDFITTDEYLYYTIRFQNVGTAEAIFVRIEDELDIQLDETTFEMLRSSHDYTVTRTGSSLEWFFDDIDLPAEQDDAEGSNGYVYFKIKPKPGYALNDVIPNTAAIYFDFNAPVITNTFNTRFVEPLSTDEFEVPSFNMYPNPAKDKVVLTANNASVQNYKITLVDVQGKEITIPQTLNNNLVELNVSSLHSGLYFVQLHNAESTLIQKLIIE